MTSEYYITMLGEFSIAYKSKKIYDQSNRSKKPWNLLEYLVANRDRSVSQAELISLLWGEESSDNPSGALKVLLHRVRKSLEPVLSEKGAELIVLKKGTYAWSTGCPVVVDTDIFEEKCRLASDTDKSASERIELYKEAFAIYKGVFLPRNNEPWVVPIASYYHTMYIKAVYEMISLLTEEQQYADIVSVCRKAISIEKMDEKLYFHLINALYQSGNQTEAIQEYSDATDLFYKKFGITPSDELKALYKTIMKTTKSLETDINIIKDALREKGQATGAFICEYEFFKDIYQLESRACARSGDSIYLCLITLSSTIGEEAPLKVMNKAMEDLLATLNETLRRGDVCARYSVSQYVLLLPTASFENVEMIMKRISSSFYKKYMKKDIGIQYKLQPLDPTL